ncbi:hypothetical protein [Ehrlichia ruminantium]|uniref:hypothetical protein n=1 Tax=Ehrlichia ruminantium TaxID=779 RepID=UPI000A84F21A|nr:hypothetical protein [Ehrlichia ruminantium]
MHDKIQILISIKDGYNKSSKLNKIALLLNSLPTKNYQDINKIVTINNTSNKLVDKLFS